MRRTKNNFEIRITKKVSLLNNLNLNNYSYKFTPTETTAGGILIYIANHLPYKCRNDLNVYIKNEMKSTFIKINILLKINILFWDSFTDINVWILLTLVAVT